MQPPQRGIPRLLAMKDPTNPVLMHMSPMEAQQITAMRGQGFNPQTGLPVLGRAEGGMLQSRKPPYSDVAQELEEKGRYGDTHLLHVRDDELQGLSSLGQLTINPDTGLPEAFSFKSLLPAIGAIAGAALAPFTFGTSMLAVGAMAGLGSFAGGLAAGQGVGQAALGGLMSGVTAGFMAGAPTGLEALGPGVEGGVGAGIGAGTSGSMAAVAEGVAIPFTEAVAGTAGAQALGTGATSFGTGAAMPASFSKALAATPSSSFPGQSLATTTGAATMPSYGSSVLTQAAKAGITDPGIVSSNTGIGVAGDFGSTAPYSFNQPMPENVQSVLDMNAAAAVPTPPPVAAPVVRSADQFARITPNYEAPGEFKQFFGAEDLSGQQFATRQQYLDAGGIADDITMTERLSQIGKSPGTYIGLAGSVLSQPPEYGEFEEDLTLSGSSYVPRTRRLVGGEQRSAGTTEEIRNRYIQGGDAQPLVSPYRFVAEGGLVGLTPDSQSKEFISSSSLSALSKTPEDRKITRGVSTPSSQKTMGIQEIFNNIQGQGTNGFLSAILAHTLSSNPEAMSLINKSNNQSSPRHLQLQEFGLGKHGYFDTGAKGLQSSASGGLIGLSGGGMTNGNSSSYSSNNAPSFNGGGQPEQMSFLPISLQHMMNRLGATDPAPFIEFAKRTRDVESSGGRDKINDKSSARGNYQWLTKVDPKAKKGEHNSVKTAANRLQKIYRDAEQDIPQWLKTLNINSTKSTKDLEKNVLSLTSEQEDQLFYANINLAKGSDQYLPLIAQGDTEAMLNAYGEIHHTNMKKPTRDVAENIFLSEFKIDAPINVGQGTGLDSLSQDVVSETMVDERINTPYTVQQGDTLSQLAAKSGISVDDIMKANLGRISDPDKIYTGQQIALSDSSDIPNPVRMGSQGDESSMDSILETIKQFLPNFAEGGGISQYYAEGGDIGRYYEGQVVGQGDGMSDQMLFEVQGDNPDKALLSRDEYVIPADVVAMLGNGSSNAGAEQLDHFMKGIRQQSFGTTKQQKQMNPQQGLAQLA